MKKILILLLLVLSVSPILSQSKVYVANIEDEIDLGLAPYVRRVVEEAELNNADAIIFKINTFGGRVDAATQIKDAIINSKVKTIAFIDKRAISAGALISLSCEKIVMVPGASIGASTVVDQTGKKVSEKYQSYMRSEMRATAEKNGRPKDIAEGMVDERVVVEGLVDSTQLITLTSKEAMHYAIADTILSSEEEALSYFGIEDAELVTVKANWAEDVVRFLNNPIISSLLIMIGMFGMFAEIKSPGWGLPGTAAIVALALFFGTNYILEMASIVDILIFVIGVLLLLAEIFVIPGFGVFGVAGILCIVTSLFLGLIGDLPYVDWDIISGALFQLSSALLLSILSSLLLIKILPKSAMFNKLILNDNIDAKSGYTAKENFSHYENKKGKAITDLRPSGSAEIDGKRIDVVTEGDYIESGAAIEVIHVEGSNITVREIKA